MRKETRKEERVVVSNYTVYIANDGTEFDSERACEMHEICAEIDRTEKEVEDIRLPFCAAPLNYDGYTDEDHCEWYKVNNENDYQKLIDYYRARTADEVSIDRPSAYPSVICVSEDVSWTAPYEVEYACGYTLDDMKKTAEGFFAHFGITVKFENMKEGEKV